MKTIPSTSIFSHFSFLQDPDTALTKQARGRPKSVTFHADQGCHYNKQSFSTTTYDSIRNKA